MHNTHTHTHIYIVRKIYYKEATSINFTLSTLKNAKSVPLRQSWFKKIIIGAPCYSYKKMN